MSAPTSLHQHQPNQVQMKATSGGRPQQERAAASKQSDLIETKFNQLARKILAELQPNSARAQQFFIALDSILQEPQQQTQHQQQPQPQPQHSQNGLQKSPSSGRLSRSGSKKQLVEQQEDLTRKCDILLAKQKMQQDQLDSHQQILFDKQYESLPAEITGAGRLLAARSQATPASGQRAPRGGVRKTATTSKLAERKSELEQEQSRKSVGADERASSSAGHSKRSAIPTSTILAGINQLAKSATTGSFSSSGDQAPQFSRQSSLRLKSGPQSQEQQQQLAVPSSQSACESEANRNQLTASEKLKQRRPTKASVAQQARLSPDSDDDEDDDDDDDDDDDAPYVYQNLAAGRAHLNQRFMQPASAVAGQPVAKSKTFSELKTTEVASRLAAGQKQQQQPAQAQRQQQVRNLVVKSQTGTGGLQARAAESEEDDEDEEVDEFDDESEGPRSINGLLTSQSGNMMYKPHMNYSQSLLGNHRLSDDDEIIIIPTAQSPTPSLLMSASPSPIGGRASQQQQQRALHSQASGDQEPGGNLDEFNERFSISRTKSFWEKLAGSKKIVGGEPASQNKQQSDANNNKPLQQHHSSVPNKSAFDRLDSTGGSGNSYHSGCSSNSSTSGDDQAAAAAAAYANRHLNPLLVGQQKQSAPAGRAGARQQSTWTAPNPTVKQLVHQEQMQRSDRFRQTR